VGKQELSTVLEGWGISGRLPDVTSEAEGAFGGHWRPGAGAGPPQSLRASSQPYRSAMESAMFFSLSLLDCGALIWGTTGLSSLFISSSTLSAFCSIVFKIKEGIDEIIRKREKEKQNNPKREFSEMTDKNGSVS